MLSFSVQSDRCTQCGLCVRHCPSRIIEQNGDKVPFVSAENEENCLQCQHCLAVCPTGAISVFGLNPADSLPVSPDRWPTFEQMTHLVRGRRSVRFYHDKDVEPDLISRLLASSAHAPTGCNSRMLTFTVIDKRDVLHCLRDKVMQGLAKADKEGRIPSQTPFIKEAISAYYDRHIDGIFRGAPHAIIVSAPPEAPCGMADIPISLAYFELSAETAGLGAVWWGMLNLACDTVPELKPLFGLAANHHYGGMLFGYPAIYFARTGQRDHAATIRRLGMPGVT
jgi:NAD-dependent dihydropyrimidine dehydrogenase PreA subunit/nitroreductase